MPLTWDTEGVTDWESVCFLTSEYDDPMNGVKVGDRIVNPVTTALIYHTMNVGISRITDENVGEFWARLNVVESLEGANLWNADGPRPITREEVIAHIGLRTNASSLSRREFLRRVANVMDEEVERLAHIRQLAV